MTSGLRILLAESNPVTRALAVALLRKAGHVPVTADTSADAARSLAEQPFDLALLDLDLPGDGGLAVARAVRAREAGGSRRLPLVALATTPGDESRRRSLDAGMDAYLATTFLGQDLLPTLHQLLPAAAPSQPANRPPAPSVLNRAEAIRRVGGNVEKVEELAALFRREGPRLLEEVHQALAAGDGPRVQRAAHSLKGTVGVFGARAAIAAAGQLETLARTGNLAACAGLVAALQHSVEQLQAELEELVPRPG